MRLIDADALKESIRKVSCIRSFVNLLPSEKAIIDQIDSAPTIGGWISVKDRLPEAKMPDADGNITFSDYVLTYQTYKDGFSWVTADTCRVDHGVWMHEVPGSGCKVTHWMPLPEPPQC